MSKRLPPNTLASIGDGALPLYAHCLRCRHWSPVKVLELAKRFGWGAGLGDIAPKLRCLSCGSKNCELVTRKPKESRCSRCGRPY
ncbi:MAG: hypothetical protein DIU71_13355 [Proteobacteria bacterium]|nr:MAG: hypothetical protein DIU71_13355 [Pseudomonadota bacterium]